VNAGIAILTIAKTADQQVSSRLPPNMWGMGRIMSTSPEASGRRKKPAFSPLRRFAGNSSGATAIEFAMLALPFFLLVLAIIEVCLSFGGQQVLVNATNDVARQYRTGQIRPTNNPAADETKLRDEICERLEIIVSSGCPGLTVDLQSYTTFEDAAKVPIAYPDKDVATPGLAGSKNMLRAYYRWPLITDLLQLMGSKDKDGTTMHFAVAVWQNEPFND
jgi:Flp pilus assembly protein TadG